MTFSNSKKLYKFHELSFASEFIFGYGVGDLLEVMIEEENQKCPTIIIFQCYNVTFTNSL